MTAAVGASNPLEFVNTVTTSLLPAKTHIPPYIMSALGRIRHIWVSWRWFRQGQLYTNKNNLYNLMCGNIVAGLGGKCDAIRRASYVLLIANRIICCRRLISNLGDTISGLWDAVRGKYPPPINCSWKRQWKTNVFSASTEFWIREKALSFKMYMLRIWEFTVRFFKELFLLSMYILETIDAFFIDPKNPNHDVRINEIFINGASCLDEVVTAEESFLGALRNHKDIIEPLLEKLNSPISYAALERSVSKTLNGTRAFKKGLEFGGKIVQHFLYHVITGAIILSPFGDQAVKVPRPPTDSHKWTPVYV